MKKFIQISSIIKLSLLSLFISGCSTTTFYEVYNVTSTSDVQLDTVAGFISENNDIRLNYNFWEDKGIMYFTVYNKAKKPLYIDLNRSHLILNDRSFDYFRNSETSNSSQTNSSSIQIVEKGEKKTVSYSTQNATVVKDKPVYEIPPHSYIVINYFNLVDSKYVNCKLFNPKTFPATFRFDADSIPLRFRNYITYSTTSAIENPQVVENSFWVDEISYMRDQDFLGKSSPNIDCPGDDAKQPPEKFQYPYKKPNKFYYTIIKKN